MSTLILTVALAAILTPLLIRDCRRAEMRRRLRPMARAFDALKVQIGVALVPAMRQAVVAAADMERSFRKVSDAMKANPDTFDALRKYAESMSRKETDR